jgi:hypothetical protein
MAEFGKRTKREARALAQGGKEGAEVYIHTIYIYYIYTVCIIVTYISEW